ncbi:hypothetical protein [Crucivirus-475]|nr:hypothetical protein [Crucivirus-475]
MWALYLRLVGIAFSVGHNTVVSSVGNAWREVQLQILHAQWHPRLLGPSVRLLAVLDQQLREIDRSLQMCLPRQLELLLVQQPCQTHPRCLTGPESRWQRLSSCSQRLLAEVGGVHMAVPSCASWEVHLPHRTVLRNSPIALACVWPSCLRG